MQRIKFFLEFLWNFVTKSTQLSKVSVRTYRMDICKGCPYYNNKWCDECGCYLPLKTQFKVSECPMGNWGMDGEHSIEDQIDAGWE